MAGNSLAAILFVVPFALTGAQRDSILLNNLRNFTLLVSFNIIRGVDFRNFNFGDEDCVLKDGPFKHDAFDDHQSFHLEAVHY